MLKNITSAIRWSRRSAHNLQNNTYHPLIDVHPAVQRALQRGQPIVALESTIITHGMPWPQNLQTAQEVEELVLEQGATPATIAIMNGRIKVGLGAEELQTLAKMQPEQVIKCSRRDLPFLLAQQRSGGTTVASTMLIAHMVGLKIFATGGVGGVHRDGHNTLDISADLVELGRTPVTVVCSGVKSILDVPRTLEFLETQGVCIATYGSAEGRFPDFFTADSGQRVSYNLQTPAEAARLIETLHTMRMQSGILIAVPIPPKYAADKQQIDAAIAEAQAQANAAKLSGKQVTPFLLAAIAKITGGSSLQSNMALIKNNAITAAQIAKELYAAKSSQTLGGIFMDSRNNTDQKVAAPLVVGASILDLSLTMLDDMPSSLDGATYHTRAKQSAGGVGRNIAEGIYKLYGSSNFISCVGNDQLGASLLQLMPQPLRTNINVAAQQATSLCSVLLDKAGDCKLVLGNMEIHETISAECVQQHEQLLRTAPLIVMDGNLPLSTMQRLLELAQQHQKPVFFEPTDMRIGHKPFQLPPTLTSTIRMISPNIHELQQIVATITGEAISCDTHKLHSKEALLKETKKMLLLIQQHFDIVLVTLGEHGVVLSVRGDVKQPLFAAATGRYLATSVDAKTPHSMLFFAAETVPHIANVSGAGDSFASGFIAGLLKGHSVERCISFGFVAARRALQSESAVPAQYFNDAAEESEALETAHAKLRTANL